MGWRSPGRALSKAGPAPLCCAARTPYKGMTLASAEHLGHLLCETVMMSRDALEKRAQSLRTLLAYKFNKVVRGMQETLF